MKYIITFILILFCFVSFSQKENNIDTNEICLPSTVAKKMVLDLNELDRLKENEKLTKNEILELENKVIKQDSIISKLVQKDINNQLIINGVEEKYKLVEQDNKDLRNKLKWGEIKNNIIEIVSGAILTSVIYIELFK